MAEWVASLNKQEEGESEVNRIFGRMDDDLDCRAECRHSKMKSGILDKSTTNIRHHFYEFDVVLTCKSTFPASTGCKVAYTGLTALLDDDREL